MVVDPFQYQTQGQDYAANMAASQDPFINLFRSRLGSMRSREQLAQEISGLYDPAIRSAQSLGANVAGANVAGLSALTGLGSALPGSNIEGLSEAYRSAGRAGASASMLGTVLETGARQGLAESIMQRQAESEAERFGTEDRLAGAESEKTRIGADWLGAAQGFQGMGSQYLQDVARDQETRFQAERQPLEMERMRQDIAAIMANTELTQEQKLGLIQQRELDAQFGAREREAGLEQAAAGTRLTNQQANQIINEIRSRPAPQVARDLSQRLLRGELTLQDLQTAGLIQELKRGGMTRAMAKNMAERGGATKAEVDRFVALFS